MTHNFNKWAKLNKFSRDKLLVCTTALFTFFIVFLTQDSLDRQFARQHLASQAQTLLTTFERSIKQSQIELVNLPPVAELSCNEGVSVPLAQRVFANTSLRWIGIETKGQLICRSHVIGMTINNEKNYQHTTHRFAPTWLVESLPTPDKGRSLFLVQERGDLRYVSALDLPNLEDIANPDCRNCIEYALFIEGKPQLQINSKPMPEETWVERSATGEGPNGLKLRLALKADLRYLESFRLQSRIVVALIALCVSFLAAWLMFKLLRTRSSMSFLIQEGLRRESFVPYYQPIIDSRDGTLLGAEALARWEMPDGKIIPPLQFISYAEENGLIQAITLQLSKKIVADIVRLGWSGTDRYISINLVPDQLENMEYVSYLMKLLKSHSLSTRNVSLEITERRQFVNLQKGKEVLEQLVKSGIEVKLDDAGTGFGGFAYIQELPIGTIKIDKMFVDTLRAGRDAKRPVLDAIVEFARISKLDTIAEGVETQEQIKQLASIGAHVIQGYVYGKPMPMDEFAAWIRNR